MATYARIQSGEVAELFTPPSDAAIDSCFSGDIAAQFVDVTSVTPTPKPGWAAVEASGEWSFSESTASNSALSWAAYQSMAQASLDKSDVTILRCYENAVAIPGAWATYRKSLRAIVSAKSGDATKPLPAQPAYPDGT